MRDQLILRRKEIEARLGILNGELREKREFQRQGIIGPEPGLMKSYREEIADLKNELHEVTAALMQFRADPRNDINHWFRHAAYESLDVHQYSVLVDRAHALRREYQAGQTAEPAGPADERWDIRAPALTWTSERPTVPGGWWIRQPGFPDHVHQYDQRAIDDWRPDLWSPRCMFAGPIPGPAEPAMTVDSFPNTDQEETYA